MEIIHSCTFWVYAAMKAVISTERTNSGGGVVGGGHGKHSGKGIAVVAVEISALGSPQKRFSMVGVETGSGGLGRGGFHPQWGCGGG